MSKHFKLFLFLEDKPAFTVDSSDETDTDNRIIISMQGKAIDNYQNQSMFYLSAKILRIFKDSTIEHIKIKFVE